MLWYWLFTGPALLLAALSLGGERKRAAYVACRLSEAPEYLPPASAIVPVKGEDEGLRQNLAALASLDYPDYELMVVAGTLGPGDNRFAWGGAMAPCLEHISAARFFSWMRRQLAITRVYNARQWWPGLIAHIFYCGGMAASVIASVKGYRLAEWALAAQLFPGMLQGFNRATLAKAALPEYEAWFRRRAWVHVIWVPLATWIWLVGLAASAFGNTIEWRGYQYGLKRGASIIST